MLDLSSLALALAALNTVLGRVEDRELMSTLDEGTRQAVRAGVIQHFELTYELCWKFMQRWLQANVTPDTGDGVTRRELFRLAAEDLLITDVTQWMTYNQQRNLISHTYVPAIADGVLAIVPAFARDAAALLARLEANKIKLEPVELVEVQRILAAQIPGREVRAFGSRVHGPVKPYSDLDLVIYDLQPLAASALGALQEAFQESELNFRVDVLGAHALTPAFRALIEAHAEILEPAR